MKNTELLYRKAKKYQDRRKELTEKYRSDVESLEKYKGSQGYSEELEQLQKNLEINLQKLKDEATPDIYTAIKSMYSACDSMTLPLPTIEQMNLLTMLQMKKKITNEDCQMVAQSVKDNPIAVSIVSEISREHGLLRTYDHICPKMSLSTCNTILNGMKKDIDDFLQYDTSKVARMYQSMQMEHYGTVSGDLKSRKLFESQEEFYKDFGIDADTFGKFSEIVDHE